MRFPRTSGGAFFRTKRQTSTSLGSSFYDQPSDPTWVSRVSTGGVTASAVENIPAYSSGAFTVASITGITFDTSTTITTDYDEQKVGLGTATVSFDKDNGAVALLEPTDTANDYVLEQSKVPKMAFCNRDVWFKTQFKITGDTQHVAEKHAEIVLGWTDTVADGSTVFNGTTGNTFIGLDIRADTDGLIESYVNVKDGGVSSHVNTSRSYSWNTWYNFEMRFIASESRFILFIGTGNAMYSYGSISLTGTSLTTLCTKELKFTMGIRNNNSGSAKPKLIVGTSMAILDK